MRILTSAVLGTPVSIIAMTIALPVAAQVEAGRERGEPLIQEVIVTATKHESQLKDVPMTVDVATGEQIEAFNLFDFKNVQALAPGLQLSSNGRNTVATLRGISFDPDIGGPAAIGVYFNEIPVDVNIVSTAMYDVQQVEVLRGPQGTLRGRTAPAGAITITTRRADLNDVTGQLQATFTDQDGRNLQGALSLPIVAGRLALRVAGLSDRNRANHTYSVNRGERSHQESESVRATLSFAPTNTFSGNIVYQYLDSYLRQGTQVFGSGNQPSLLSPQRSGPAIDAADRYSVQSGLSYYTNKTHMLVGDFEWELDEYTLSGLAGYQDAKLYSQSDQDTGNAVVDLDKYLTVPNPTTNVTAEVRLDSNYDGFFNLTLGAFYNKNKSDSASSFRVDSLFANQAPPTPFPVSMFSLPITALVDIHNHTEDLAIFGNARFQVTEQMRIETGARLTRNEAYAQSYLTVMSPGGVGLPIPPFTSPNYQPTVDPEFVEQVERPLTGTASLSYDWTPDVTTYVTYGRSFRRGSAQLGVTSTLDSSLLVLQPEHSDAIEIGVKSRLFERASLNLAAFYQKFDGFIGLTSVVTSSARDGVIDGGVFTASFNGDAIAKGIEMQFDAAITSYWSAMLTMAYSEARYDDALAPCNDFNFDGIPDSNGTPAVPVGQQVSYCRLNNRLTDSPDFSLSATSELHVPIGVLEGFVRGLFTHGGGYRLEAADYRVSSMNTLNLFAGVRNAEGRWELSLFAKNVFNDDSITGVGSGELQASTRYLVPQPGGSPPPPSFRSGYRTVSMREPREFGATLSFNF